MKTVTLKNRHSAKINVHFNYLLTIIITVRENSSLRHFFGKRDTTNGSKGSRQTKNGLKKTKDIQQKPNCTPYTSESMRTSDSL
jgi:phospholipase C